MKARIVIAPQLVLSYGLTDEQSKTLDDITAKLNAKHKPVPYENANEKIGWLCEFKGFEKADKPCENPPPEQCLVFSGVDRKTIQPLLSELKSSGLIIPLKAMVTATNQSWTLTALIDELKKEHKMMTERK